VPILGAVGDVSGGGRWAVGDISGGACGTLGPRKPVGAGDRGLEPARRPPPSMLCESWSLGEDHDPLEQRGAGGRTAPGHGADCEECSAHGVKDRLTS
jgi:hypothetical protein